MHQGPDGLAVVKEAHHMIAIGGDGNSCMMAGQREPPALEPAKRRSAAKGFKNDLPKQPPSQE